ncbi:FtsW/RodA/SpoVE family cell cycle protein [Clostridium brassicae]|uniref:FtsW/RodA/SpoVE family cell cycle protein n=1 Tax=Clostridium brassicae TaxID=2999072 RepID=A0ABT4DD41_9CLOT|nr:FtsW/RodA/SpoVE family cell cycle protein [Clostridium brassicae]MCY6960234.1 FtsW/RodA/SpoVE family cell cycle protein [Clostridium brassicae]
MSIDKTTKIKNYINDVCSYIKLKEAHHEIASEISSHIEDIYEEGIKNGLSKEVALDEAIKRMGNPSEVGKQLNLAHKGSPDWITLILTLALVNIGVILMYILKSNNIAENIDYIFNRSLLSASLGSLMIVLLYLFDYRKLEKYSKYIFVSTITLLILFTQFVHFEDISQVTIVTTIASYILIISLAGIFTNWNWNRKTNLLKGIFLLALPSAIMTFGNSTASAVIYTAGFIVLALKSRIKLKYIFSIGIISISAVSFTILNRPYMLKRLTAFLSPQMYSTGIGYINVQLKTILSSSSFLGKGIVDAKYTLPKLHTEFIFSYILSSFGWFSIIILVILITGFIIRMTRITKNIKDEYGKLLCSGLISILLVQFLLNILMNLNLVPLMGISLPFISYGGILCLFNMISVGLILSAYRRRNISSSKKYLEDNNIS